MQNLGSSACGCRERAVSAVVEFGEVSVLGLGCARLGSLTAARTRREGFSLLAAAPNAGITLSDTVDIYEQGESERILGDALKSIDACIVTKARRRFSLAKSVLLPLRGAAGRFSVHPSHARAAAVAARAKPSPRNQSGSATS
jgi:aryl-alcohol dehydrogenase-like predicted oxidoreductase